MKESLCERFSPSRGGGGGGWSSLSHIYTHISNRLTCIVAFGKDLMQIRVAIFAVHSSN